MKTYKALAALILFATMRSVSFADTVVLLPQEDNTLYEDPTGQLSNGHGIYLFAGKTSSNLLRRGLIAFDLTSIPTNTTITGATLSMFLSLSSPDPAGVNISLSKALRGWGEGASDAGEPGGAGAPAQAADATWIHNFYNTSFWSAPGGDFSTVLSATTPVSTVNATYTWSGSGLLADVQSWVSNPASNFGWVILGNEINASSGRRFNTRENTSNPPQLTVTYQLSSATPTPTPTPIATPTPSPATLGNISTRLQVGTGDRVMIAGFIVQGSGPKRVLIRAAGPSLTEFGVPDALANPRLELHDSNNVIAMNDNWQTTQIGGVITSDQVAEIQNSGVAPRDEAESAVIATLAPGSYTAIVQGVNSGTGVGIVEVYDLSPTSGSLLANIGTRGFVETGDNVMIGGFIVVTQPTRVIIRAIGPSLTESGVPDALANPQLELHDANSTVAQNDDWQTTQFGGVITTDQVAEIQNSQLAPTNPAESAIIATLQPGSYTALVRGMNDTTGNALVEVYALSPTPTAIAVTLPILPVLAPTSSDTTTDYYDITMQVGTKQIIPGKLTTIWGYNGMYPGPTIKARSGRRTVVRQVNNLQESVSVHLHGGHTPADSDGHPTDLVGPGATKTYIYPNNQVAANLWYHDHAIDVTGRHIYMGLSAFYLISDSFEDSLPLPKGNNDVSLLIQDRLFNSDGSLSYPLTDSTIRTGVVGDILLVNGAIQPYFQVGRRKVRFRILNGSNARIYKLALSTGDSFTQIGSDGGLLSNPVSRQEISLAPAERIDVVIDFSRYPAGTSVVLRNQDTAASPSIPDVMRFDVVREETDDSSIPATLRPIVRLAESSASVTRTFTLSQTFQNGRNDIWTINGQLYDPARLDATPQLNTTEIWTFQNNSGQAHPMHIHDIQCQILDINGIPPAPGDDGLKDTFLVPARGGTVRVIGTFTDNLGLYVSHCHILEHEDHAMMINFAVQP
jgi:spore coat protein A, manganese oxidase